MQRVWFSNVGNMTMLQTLCEIYIGSPLKIVMYKILLTIHKGIYGISPQELNELLIIESSRTFNLQIHKHSSTYGSRAFCNYAGKNAKDLSISLNIHKVGSSSCQRLSNVCLTHPSDQSRQSVGVRRRKVPTFCRG